MVIDKFKFIKNKKHTCNKDTNLTEKDNISTQTENIKYLIEIIKRNPLIKISEIKLKLLDKQISLSENTIKYFLNKIREDIYIKDEEYIKIIQYDKITYQKNDNIIKEIFFMVQNLLLILKKIYSRKIFNIR